jgi:perosamine synthetase
MIRQYTPWVATNQKKYVNDCLDENYLSHRGKYGKLFEAGLAAAAKRKHAALTGSGTAALFAMYYAEGLVGKRVLAPTLTYAATINQLILIGATPVLVDCDERHQMEINQVREGLARGLADAVVVAPLYGDAPNMLAFELACHDFGVPLLVDGAQAFGADWNGRPVLSYGRSATLSFFAGKTLGTGEGGCVFTDDEEVDRRARDAVNHNTYTNYRHGSPYCTNSRMTNLQAAVGLAQLEDAPAILQNKRRVHTEYARLLPAAVLRPRTGLAWVNVVRVKPGLTYAEVEAVARAAGVELRPMFAPLHTLPGYASRVDTPFPLRASEVAAATHVSLPSGPTLTAEEIGRVADAVRPFLVD